MGKIKAETAKGKSDEAKRRHGTGLAQDDNFQPATASTPAKNTLEPLKGCKIIQTWRPKQPGIEVEVLTNLIQYLTELTGCALHVDQRSGEVSIGGYNEEMIEAAKRRLMAMEYNSVERPNTLEFHLFDAEDKTCFELRFASLRSASSRMLRTTLADPDVCVSYELPSMRVARIVVEDACSKKYVQETSAPVRPIEAPMPLAVSILWGAFIFTGRGSEALNPSNWTEEAVNNCARVNKSLYAGSQQLLDVDKVGQLQRWAEDTAKEVAKAAPDVFSPDGLPGIDLLSDRSMDGDSLPLDGLTIPSMTSTSTPEPPIRGYAGHRYGKLRRPKAESLSITPILEMEEDSTPESLDEQNDLLGSWNDTAPADSLVYNDDRSTAQASPKLNFSNPRDKENVSLLDLSDEDSCKTTSTKSRLNPLSAPFAPRTSSGALQTVSQATLLTPSTLAKSSSVSTRTYSMVSSPSISGDLTRSRWATDGSNGTVVNRQQTFEAAQSVACYRTMGQKGAFRDLELTPPRKMQQVMIMILERARSYRGELKLHIDIGRLLMKDVQKTYSKPFPTEEWDQVFKKEKVLQPARTIFTNMLTSSFVDAEYMIDLTTTDNQRMFKQIPSAYRVTYDFRCRTGADEEIIVEVDGESFDYEIKRSHRSFGAVYLHHPKREWDAVLRLDGTECEDEPEGVKRLVENIYVPARRQLADVSTRTPADKLVIDSVMLKRQTRHTAHPSYGELELHVTEVQDLVIQRRPDVPGAIHAFARPSAEMISDKEGCRLWYEVSLVPSDAQTLLEENLDLELGEETSWWTPKGIKTETSDESSEEWSNTPRASVTRREASARPAASVSNGDRNPPQLAGAPPVDSATRLPRPSIHGTSLIEKVFSVAAVEKIWHCISDMMTQIDAVGYNNLGSAPKITGTYGATSTTMGSVRMSSHTHGHGTQRRPSNSVRGSQFGGFSRYESEHEGRSTGFSAFGGAPERQVKEGEQYW
ncbi:MAG: hypothetical protein M1817_002449 [Caeruleum heppii]|nr:MAG: hypothetical protein M1817_002449 [Caeruleum heppii]